MAKNSSISESVIYLSVKAFGAFIRVLPAGLGLLIGRGIGALAYYFDLRHRALAYANLKVAFAKSKSPEEIRRITKEIFANFGQNLIEILRLPLLNKDNYAQFIEIEGKEHAQESLKGGKGCMLVAMHFGSWELSSFACSLLGKYKLVIKPQTTFASLNDLLNSYRGHSGTMTVAKGMGIREMLRGLHNNELVGIVVDQGGRDGKLVPFFGRQASMSVGAIRIALKMGVPLCFCIIRRVKGAKHHMRIFPAMMLHNTDNLDADIDRNLRSIVQIMEKEIERYPTEYNWFYKIWKYSTESTTLILSDGKVGHLRQSECLASHIAQALKTRGIASEIKTIPIQFKSPWRARLISVAGLLANRFLCQGRQNFLKFFLTEECYRQIMAFKADFIVSCGSSLASLNFLLTMDHKAKNVAILKPGLLGYKKFDLVVMLEHDFRKREDYPANVVWTKVAPNLINSVYLTEQGQMLLKRYAVLKQRLKLRIGFLLGGDTRRSVMLEKVVKMVLNQLKEAATELNADILATTSRRTSNRIEGLVTRELKGYERCPVLIMPNRNNIPEAVGGILDLSDILLVSGDSISMISEAVSAGKNTIIFPLEGGGSVADDEVDKYTRFGRILHRDQLALLSDPKDVRQHILNIARQKIKLRVLEKATALEQAVQRII